MEAARVAAAAAATLATAVGMMLGGHVLLGGWYGVVGPANLGSWRPKRRSMPANVAAPNRYPPM